MPKRSHYMKKADRELELQLALINAFAQDPELKYYVGMASGAGIAWMGKLLGDMGVQSSTGEDVVYHEYANPWEYLIPVKGFATIGSDFHAWVTGEKEKDTANLTAGGWGLPIHEIMAIGGTGFAGFCASVLLFRAIFGTGGAAELLKGIGEIVPL